MMRAGASGRLGAGSEGSPTAAIASSYDRQPGAVPWLTSRSAREPGSTSAGTRSSSKASASSAAGVQSANSRPFSRAVLSPLTGTAMAPTSPHAMYASSSSRELRMKVATRSPPPIPAAARTAARCRARSSVSA